MNVKKLTRLALLTTIALIIFMVEAQIPPPIPIPGIKLGLANIVTVYAMFALSPGDALAVLVCRVFLGSVFSGQLMTLFYSMGGGLLCWLVMLLLRRLLSKKQLWVAGVFGAMFHNVGQILVAIALTRTPGLIAYLPVLLVSGILTGAFTGLCAQFLLAQLDKIGQTGGLNRRAFCTVLSAGAQGQAVFRLKPQSGSPAPGQSECRPVLPGPPQFSAADG